MMPSRTHLRGAGGAILVGTTLNTLVCKVLLLAEVEETAFAYVVVALLLLFKVDYSFGYYCYRVNYDVSSYSVHICMCSGTRVGFGFWRYSLVHLCCFVTKSLLPCRFNVRYVGHCHKWCPVCLQ